MEYSEGQKLLVLNDNKLEIGEIYNITHCGTHDVIIIKFQGRRFMACRSDMPLSEGQMIQEAKRVQRI